MIAKYCCKDHQKKDWSGHKKVCGKQKKQQAAPNSCDARLSHQSVQTFIDTKAMRMYQGSFETFGRKIFERFNAKDPILIFASKITQNLLPGDMHDPQVRQLQIQMLTASPVVPVLDEIFRGFPFEGAFEIDQKNDGVRPKTNAGFNLLEYASTFAQAVYEGFYKGLVGPLGSLSHKSTTFKKDILARPTIAGKHPPVFVIGLARSGTSVLQLLLSMDPAARAPLNWEYRSSPSFQTAKDRIKHYQRKYTPPEDHQRALELSAEHPAEDTILGEGCGGIEFSSEDDEARSWNNWAAGVPNKSGKNEGRDLLAFFCAHRMAIRLLETQSPPPSSHWVFKDPTHLGYNLSTILQVYPNARFVWSHRNFTDIVGSYLNGAALPAEQIQQDSLPRDLILALASDLQQGMAFRTTGRYEAKDLRGVARSHYKSASSQVLSSQEDRFQDIFLEDLLKDPVLELQRLYTNWGLGKMSPEHIQRIETWKASKHQRSSFSYPSEHMGAIMEVMPFVSSYFQRFPRACPKNVVILPGASGTFL